MPLHLADGNEVSLALAVSDPASRSILAGEGEVPDPAFRRCRFAHQRIAIRPWRRARVTPPRGGRPRLSPDGRRAARSGCQGRGLVAEEIISRAREHGVDVHESPELVSLLMGGPRRAHSPNSIAL